MTPFALRLRSLVTERGALCVGIDPHPALLAQWGLADSAAGLERFARGVVDALGAEVACFKPQSAFFEAYGAAGVKVLEDTIRAAHQAGALVIVDAKRGDIGSTMAAYARAYLGAGPLAGDAVTLSPYLGFGSLEPAFGLAEASGQGVFVLARTSNPEGGAVQLAAAAGTTVVQSIADQAAARNRQTGLDAIGLVAGATHGALGFDLQGFTGPILAPGIGAQGGTIAGAAALFAGVAGVVLPSASREVLAAGPDPAALVAKVRALLGRD